MDYRYDFWVHTGTCNDGEVRLVGGKAEREGNLIVEMCYNGVWGTVCADGWNKIATDVVCNQLGHSNSPSKLNIKSSHARYSYQEYISRKSVQLP